MLLESWCLNRLAHKQVATVLVWAVFYESASDSLDTCLVTVPTYSPISIKLSLEDSQESNLMKLVLIVTGTGTDVPQTFPRP